jgi:RNA 3'-terminal phosphate cyclase
VAERQLDGFRRAWEFDAIEGECHYAAARSLGSSLTAVAEYTQTRLGADGLGERKVRAEDVGAGVAERLLAEMRSMGTVDVHSADNLLLWLAVFGGELQFAHLSGHIEANAYVIEQFLPGALHIDNQSARGPVALS